jgi:hypothetical protein
MSVNSEGMGRPGPSSRFWLLFAVVAVAAIVVIWTQLNRSALRKAAEARQVDVEGKKQGPAELPNIPWPGQGREPAEGKGRPELPNIPWPGHGPESAKEKGP